MATLNFAHREITAKVVYFGASGAGCNTNVKQLHKHLGSTRKSQLHKFGPRDSDERSYYFDHLPDSGDINGFSLRYRVYSLPGGLPLPAHREEVTRDVDAIVFVADARSAKEPMNLESLLALEKLLSLQGLELAAVPVVIQVNHIDEEGARRPEDVTVDLNPYGFAVVHAVANIGQGVVETHQQVMGEIAARVRDNLSGNDAAITLSAVHRATRDSDEDTIRGHLEAIQARTSSTPESVLLDDALARADTSDIPSAEVIVPFQPRELVGSRPVQLVSGRIVDDRVVLELLMQRMSSDELRRLTVVLENRPTDTPPVPRHAPPQVASTEDRVADYLPDTVDLRADEDDDLPPVFYGLIGVAGGVLMGLLAGYLLGVII